MNFEELFEVVKEKFTQLDISGMKEHLAYQFNIEGDAEGIFYVEAKEGKLHVEPYEYHDRDVLFTCRAETLQRIAEGHLDPIKAVSLKMLKVDGDIGKALKFKDLLK